MRQSLFIIALALALFGGRALRAEDDVLGGIAAIVDAGAPIAIAGIEASADKAIARINADAAITMTRITADTTKYIANDQRDVALYQAKTAMEINNENQKSVTERLAMQLGALADARHGAEAAEQQKMLVEQQYNNQRIALAQQQSAANVALAKQELALQATISGLRGQAFGYGASQLTLTNSGPRGGSAAVASATTPSSANTTVNSGAVRGEDSSSNGDSMSEGSAPAARPVPAVPRASAPKIIAMSLPKPRAMGPRSGKLPARLLASVGGGNRGARSSGSPVASRSRGAVAPGSPSPSSVAGPVSSNATRIASLQGRSHATRGNRASTTVSGGDGDSESESTDVASNRHIARASDPL